METGPLSRVWLIGGGTIGGSVDGTVFGVEHGLRRHCLYEQDGK
jgi:hypothetical protein